MLWKGLFVVAGLLSGLGVGTSEDVVCGVVVVEHGHVPPCNALI